jgi:nicotinate phosphoribosyltransferase
MKALHTDLYQLTMAAGYFEAGKSHERASFELFVRRMPRNRDLLIFVGLPQAIEYLLELRFTGEQIDYLRTVPQLHNASQRFWEYLREFRFTGDLFAMREGTPFLPNEPVLTVRAPIIEAQIPETFLLSVVSFQTMIASKALRVVRAAGERSVVEFGTRRAHSPEAGVLAGRAAYIAGCTGTSNVESGFRYGVPVFGTSAHSWVQSFAGEKAAFQELQKLLGPYTTQLIDTYDTAEGARTAASIGRPLWGVRLDSGDLAALAREVRGILDSAGLTDSKIMATGDLDETKVAALVESGAPVDSFGVGTELATSSDAPNLSAVYKMVEIEIEGIKRFTSKKSTEKETLPGSKQVFRYDDHDLVTRNWECPTCPPGSPSAEALLRPVILDGHLIEDLPDTASVRDYCASAVSKISREHRVEYSARLLQLVRKGNDA